MSALEIWHAVHDVLVDSGKKAKLEGRKAKNLVQHLVNVLRQYEEDDLEVENSDYIDRIEDTDADPNYDPSIGADISSRPPSDPQNPSMCRFGDSLVLVSEVQKAVDYYGSFGEAKRYGKKRPCVITMRKEFPFIKTEDHLRKLAAFEKSVVTIDHKNAIESVSKKLYEKVAQHLDEGHILHDSDLRSMAMTIVIENDLDIRFTASDSWILLWKKANRITSRRITKFVSRKRHVDVAVLQQSSTDFVMEAKRLMRRFNPKQIFNGDQSGFVMEMHTMRSLARTGSRHVHAVVRSESNTKKSYTVLPLVNAFGEFAPKLFVVLKEPGGKFPAKGHFQAHNLVVKAYTTHMMTKNLMLEFFQECVFDAGMPDKILLVVDSWSSWKSPEAIKSITPASKSLHTLLIPAGCTGMIQPLDVGIFGQFKKVMKTFNAYAQRNHETLNFNVAERDNVLKVLSIVYWQLCHPSLRKWAKYAWYKSGYITQKEDFQTPCELLFPANLPGYCSISLCTNPSFIICLYCKKRYCFVHFVVQYHKCM